MTTYSDTNLTYVTDKTLGKTIVMGRKTFEKIGKPLPGRRNIVLTRDLDYIPEGVEVFESVKLLLDAVGSEELFIIGGSEVYRLFKDVAEYIYITGQEENLPIIEDYKDDFHLVFEESRKSSSEAKLTIWKRKYDMPQNMARA
ncbi:MAG: dihydrofolate reductase [Cellulosilyticaceae bacterium]